ncbi:YmfQ family protein [Desulfocurvibacter africanus]|uniref:YmfQ family protein n=1 Tax=Desulfocurvibacter africanus TaxID=873 RepID=UPI0003F85612|nr:putative phage tail protein [Desulfocurvibacter africanus]
MCSASDYGRMLLALLPLGRAWPREPGTILSKLCTALGEELVRVEASAWGLLDEADPQTTVRLLPEWERACGLPDACSRAYEVLQERRAAVLARLTETGGQSLSYLQELALEFGYQIEIIEHRPFRAGQGTAGGSLTNAGWAHTFTVRAVEATITHFRAGKSAASEPLAIWGNERLECAINRAKPAQAVVIYTYGG